MSQSIICVRCGKSAPAVHQDKQFCSPKCRDKAWHAAHPGWRSANNAKHAAKRKRTAATYHSLHKVEILARNKKWKAAHPDLTRAASLRSQFKKYGMHPGDYERAFAQQGGRCHLCGSPASSSSRVKRLVVDHDHETNKVRSLLCNNCNRGIGLLRENPAVLRYAAVYLEQHGAEVIAYAA